MDDELKRTVAELAEIVALLANVVLDTIPIECNVYDTALEARSRALDCIDKTKT